MQKDKLVYFEGVNIEWQIYNYNMLNVNLIEPLRHIPYAELYFSGLLLGRWLKLKDKYMEHLEERKRAIGFGKEALIGLHARRGDHWNFVEIRDYFDGIERMGSEMGIKTVFVATDSEKIIRQLPKDSGLTFIYDDREKRYDNENARMVLNNPDLCEQETATALKNIYLLGECDGIVGSDSYMFYHGLGLSYFFRKRMNALWLRENSGEVHLTVGDGDFER